MSNKRPPEGHVERRSMTCYCSFRIRGDQTLSPQGPNVKFSGDRLSRSNSRLCVCTVNGLYYSFEYRMPDEGETGWRLKQCISLRRPPLPAQPDNMAPWTLYHAVCQGIDFSAYQICLRALKSQSHWTFFFFFHLLQQILHFTFWHSVEIHCIPAESKQSDSQNFSDQLPLFFFSFLLFGLP